jgi:hypothetical protein
MPFWPLLRKQIPISSLKATQKKIQHKNKIIKSQKEEKGSLQTSFSLWFVGLFTWKNFSFK